MTPAMYYCSKAVEDARIQNLKCLQMVVTLECLIEKPIHNVDQVMLKAMTGSYVNPVRVI
jgi:hypothetical protein